MFYLIVEIDIYNTALINISNCDMPSSFIKLLFIDMYAIQSWFINFNATCISVLMFEAIYTSALLASVIRWVVTVWCFAVDSTRPLRQHAILSAAGDGECDPLQLLLKEQMFLITARLIYFFISCIFYLVFYMSCTFFARNIFLAIYYKKT